ncbi:hypothetical protein PCL_01298 [Purpureocillium lilacinum]|uniref:Uncharacterized protein n=1 Tax=Purpureocillium lilacinum TaxID=33203 RepID=A0A2U3E325_PURLI|nr:hypothetical protein PCL_01298 [Purpureocillium lilacinum]
MDHSAMTPSPPPVCARWAVRSLFLPQDKSADRRGGTNTPSVRAATVAEPGRACGRCGAVPQMEGQGGKGERGRERDGERVGSSAWEGPEQASRFDDVRASHCGPLARRPGDIAPSRSNGTGIDQIPTAMPPCRCFVRSRAERPAPNPPDARRDLIPVREGPCVTNMKHDARQIIIGLMLCTASWAANLICLPTLLPVRPAWTKQTKTPQPLRHADDESSNPRPRNAVFVR